MTLSDFKESLDAPLPPTGISVYLEALWYDGKNNWQKAHSLIDQLEGKTAAWVHAYLHRKEGDKFNAGYWYNKAGKKVCSLSLDEEWDELVIELLKLESA